MAVLRCTLMVGILCTSLAFVQGADAKKGKAYSDALQPAASAATVDFQAELGLDFLHLRDLGVRIDRARSGDPVGLAGIAKELALAETVAKKQAKIKSADLWKEAVEAGLRRGSPTELAALQQLASDAKVKNQLAAAAKKAMQDQDDRKSGAVKRGITGSCLVVNKTSFTLYISINDRFVGSVSPFGDATFFIGDAPFSTTKLYASGGGKTATEYVPQVKTDVTWTLSNKQ